MVGSSSSKRLACAMRPRMQSTFLAAPLMILGAGFILPLLRGIPVQAQLASSSAGNVCAEAYLDSLPAPTPLNGAHRVVQMVNCSSQILLGAVPAAHQSGNQGFPVLPREGTWVMQPYSPTCSSASPTSCTNILTIDIPPEWENTKCPGGAPSCPSVLGPRFWARTGCRYDIATNRAQCETGSCADQYDCSSAAQVDSGFTSLSEWTFYQPSSDPKIFIDNPDISLVDGTSLNLDIQPVNPPNDGYLNGKCPEGTPFAGKSICNPLAPTDQHWLMYNYPLTVHGNDLRANDAATNQNCSDASGKSFVIRRSDIDKTNGVYGFVIEDEKGNPVMPAGDKPLACLNNCGRYEFAGAPSGSCNPFTNDAAGTKCYGWNVFCAGDGTNYGKSCKTDNDCKVTYMGQSLDVHASCWKNTDPNQKTGTCSLRAIYQNTNMDCPVGLPNNPLAGSPASQVACTFTYGSSNPLITAPPPANIDYSDQPPAEPCANVIGPRGNAVPCVGDDIIHQVFHGGYTWPNDPEVFDSDSPLYRVIFAPGGTSVPITPAKDSIPLCSDLPSNYKYAKNFGLCANSVLNEGADFNIAKDNNMSWSCALGSQSANTNSGVLCRWHPAPTTKSGCAPPLTDQYVTNSACGLSASGTTLVSSGFQPNNNDPLFFEVSIATPDPTKPVDLPVSISGCVPSSGPGSWTPVPGGSVTFGSQTNPDQGLVAWYTGTSNNNGQSGAKCRVTVTLAQTTAATLKVYDVPGYNGTVETTSSASGSYDPTGTSQPAVFGQSAPVATANQNDLMLGSLLQVNQQLSPITYWQDWLTNALNYNPPATINCESNLCPANDGTDYLSGHGPYSSNADAGHQSVGPGQHALERRGFVVTAFNWGGAAIYVELKPTPLAVACASTSAQVGVPYGSPLLTSGGQPNYSYAITSSPGLPPGLNLLGLSNPNIFGEPTTAGTYPYTAQVTDSANNKTSSNCSITVAPAAPTAAIAPHVAASGPVASR
jgi:hypothetical protein